MTAINRTRVLAYGVLPGLTLLLAMGSGYLKWIDASERNSQRAGVESVHVATDDTIALLSYRPDTVERDASAALDRLTGPLKDTYTALTTNVVIPQAKQKGISSSATVPAAASVQATPNHAVVLLFVNRTLTVENAPPTDTNTNLRVTLDKIGNRWLVSDLTPV
jgi:Mce-associated membrane protein